MNADQIRIVAEDLLYLRDAWRVAPHEPEIRRGSSVLRRLLIEDAYGQAWRALGHPGQPSVIAVDITDIFRDVPRSSVVIATAGGVNLGDLHLAGVCFLRDSPATPPEESPPLRPNGYPGERRYTLHDFLDSTAAIALQFSATRADVIKYFANIKGGVHLGSSGKKHERNLIQRMHKLEKKVRVVQSDGLLIELLAIGQALGTSEDAATVMEEAEELPRTD